MTPEHAAISAVVPRPLEDDFDLKVDTEGVLNRLDIHVIEEAASSNHALLNAEILITGVSSQSTSGREFAEAMPRLRWIHSMTAGIEDLVSPALLERRVLVTNGAGAYATAIAEYAFAAMVMLARGIPALAVAYGQRRWLHDHALGTELAGKRVGIVGYGGIGKAVARLCAAEGMDVWALRRRPSSAADTSTHAERVLAPAQLPELLAASDFVVVAASLNPSSRRLLARPQFEAMKPGALLVNVSRGALVDEEALAWALTSGRLAGAMIDVTTVEPLPDASQLWSLPNLWVTPHIAGGSVESRVRALEILLANVDRYLAGRIDAMLNIVELRDELASQ